MTLENNNNEKNYTERLCCSKKTKNKILNECKEEYLFHHEEMRGIKLSHDFILNKVAEFYLKSR